MRVLMEIRLNKVCSIVFRLEDLFASLNNETVFR